jgi:endonuclease/exonuclease/phosphatase (EEP) superfamily protein YafD
VLTANLHYGDGDADELVALVRAEDVDLLSVQELTPKAQEKLEAANLGDLLPHRAADPDTGASGTALYARYPLSGVELRKGRGGFAMPFATLEVPQAPPVEVMAIHPLPPVGSSQVSDWERDLSDLPGADPGETIRILAGDFNATLDHAELRDLIASGYSDAADAVGSALVPTWPRPIHTLPITIDHVLADERVYVQDVAIRDLSGSDHRMLLAKLVLPAAAGE